jgi:tetratricopeptide (TPR) repeat protein
MKYYVREEDETQEIASYVYNFHGIENKYYGNGEKLEEIALEKLDAQADPKASFLTNQLVVFVAPDKKGAFCVVGWYQDATVYRREQEEAMLDSERLNRTYYVVGDAKKAVLLPVEQRQMTVNMPSESGYAILKGQEASTISRAIFQYNGDQMNVVLHDKHLSAKLTLPMAYEQYFYKADEFLAKDCYAKALRCFNRAIFEAPDELLGYEAKASVLLSLKLYDAAKALYTHILTLDKEAYQAYYCLALIAFNQAAYDEAVKSYTIYLNFDSKNAEAWAELGYSYYLAQNQEEAARALKKAKMLDGANLAVAAIADIVLKTS